MTDELHRLALNYRTAQVHTEVVAAWDALERYEAKLLHTIEVQTRRNFERTAKDVLGGYWHDRPNAEDA